MNIILNAGVKFLKVDLLVTTSVDQRLSLWSYDSGEAMLKLASSFTHDVADVASMEVLKNRLAIAAEFHLQALAYFL